MANYPGNNYIYPGNSWFGIYPPSMSNNQTYQSQSYTPVQPQTSQGIIWVDGEVGAKAFQMPVGWPSDTPIALWDTNDQIIYLKSINQVGMPKPLQRIHYQMEETKQSFQAIPGNGTVTEAKPVDTDRFATKDDLESMKNEIREMLKSNSYQRNQNGPGNRGENK